MHIHRRRLICFVSTLTLLVTLGEPARAELGDNSVGICAHDGRAAFIDAAADAGLQWVRLDGNWFMLEPTQGNYNWWLDTPVQNATNAGLDVFITLAYTPDWATRYGDTDGNAINDIPDKTQWAAFVTAAVTHYRAMGVTHFGLWNEANLQHFFEGSAQEYVDFVVVPGAAAVRAACADCKVLGPDLANVGAVDVFLEAVLTEMPVGSFDIVTHHIYNGFPELGTAVWDGDRYFNVLDEPRIPGYTRRPIRELLDQAGYDGEVWITETGYRATPNDAGDEDRQATYLTLALDQQLARDWVTNTFVYESHDCGPDQPACDIDGFGIMRANTGSTMPRSFPDDFRLKPAFDALKQYVAGHSEFDDVPPETSCNDGVDNDHDGAVDLADRGCVSPGDDDEGDEVPREEMIATRNDGIVVDGALEDFGAEGWVALSYPDDWAGLDLILDPSDLDARAAVRWTSGAVYLGVEVRDDIHENTLAPDLLWQGDSVQLAFDIGQNGGRGYDNFDDHEINVALSSGAVSTYRFHGPAGASDDVDAAVVRDESSGTTTYEIMLPSSALPGVTFATSTVIGFSFLINESDTGSRSGWLQWSSGIGTSKDPREFGQIVFTDAPPAPAEDVEVADVDGDTRGADAGEDTSGSGSDVADTETAPGDLWGGADTAQADTQGPTQGGGDAGGCGCRVRTNTAPTLPVSMGILALFGAFVATRRRLP